MWQAMSQGGLVSFFEVEMGQKMSPLTGLGIVLDFLLHRCRTYGARSASLTARRYVCKPRLGAEYL